MAYRHISDISPSTLYSYLGRKITLLLRGSLWVLPLACVLLGAQKKRPRISYIADELLYEKTKDKSCLRLQGHVVFTQEDKRIGADKVEFYEADHMAVASGSVVFSTQDGLRFQTQSLRYSTDKEVFSFDTPGLLTQKDLKLTCQKGTYNDLSKEAHLHGAVRLRTPDYIIRCDTMRYNTLTKEAYFEGHSIITSLKDNTRTHTRQKGRYTIPGHTSTERQDTVQNLYADRIAFNHVTGDMYATGHVRVLDTAQRATFYSAKARYKKKDKTFTLEDDPLLVQDMENNQKLFVRASRMTLQETQQGYHMQALDNVRMYAEQFQAFAHRITYNTASATMQLDQGPMFWQHSTQACAGHITVQLHKKHKYVRSIRLQGHPVLANQNALGHFDQIIGTDMHMDFTEGKIHTVGIQGRTELLFHVLQHDTQWLGTNHCTSTNIDMRYSAGKMQHVYFPNPPQGRLYPPHAVDAPQKLAGFVWYAHKRPTLAMVQESSYVPAKKLHGISFLPRTVK